MIDARARLAADGAVQFPGALSAEETQALADRLDVYLGSRPGARLHPTEDLAALLATDGPIGQIASTLLGPQAFATRALLFDKTVDANWQVAWHQDRTIPVAEWHEVQGFGPWSVKDGVPHVAPPIELLARMVTLRVHLDACDSDNAPLVVALGSHQLGRVPAMKPEPKPRASRS